jgi:ABC-type antimicrobial peptide transport system permease subunit
MVVLDAMRAVAPGLMLGGILSIASAGTLRTLLYDVSPVDPLAIGAAIVILALAAIGSSLIPAIRSTRIDPMLAIRGE